MTAETRKRKEIRELERKRKQQLYILIGIVVVAILAVAAAVILNNQLTQSGQMAALAAEGAAYQGIEASLSEEGMPQLGAADAPMAIYEYSSFGCGHCMNFAQNQFPQLLDSIRGGDVRFVSVLVTNQFSAPASLAAFCAADQGKFWEMQDILFGYLGQYGNTAYTRERLNQAASALSLDTNTFNACLTSDAAAQQVEAANNLFYDLAGQYPNSVTGTPTLTFNGVPPEWGSGAPPMNYILDKIAEVTG